MGVNMAKVKEITTEDVLRRAIGLIEALRALLPSLPDEVALKIAGLLDAYDRDVVAGKFPKDTEKEEMRKRLAELEGLRDQYLGELLKKAEKEKPQPWPEPYNPWDGTPGTTNPWIKRYDNTAKKYDKWRYGMWTSDQTKWDPDSGTVLIPNTWK